MKIRHGYVSNSSSSSFIIGYNDSAVAKVEGLELGVEKFMRLVDSMPDIHGDCTKIIREGKKAIIAEIEEWFDEEIIDKIKENNNKNLVYLQISYDDELIQTIFDFIVNTKSVNLIYSSNG